MRKSFSAQPADLQSGGKMGRLGPTKKNALDAPDLSDWFHHQFRSPGSLSPRHSRPAGLPQAVGAGRDDHGHKPEASPARVERDAARASRIKEVDQLLSSWANNAPASPSP